MPSLTLSDQMIWFAHCPKAGGTSIETLMTRTWEARVGHLHWGWDLWWRDGGWKTCDPPNSPQHLTWDDAVRVLPALPDQSFAIVRHPVDRLASEYRYHRQHRRGRILGKLLSLLPFPIWARIMLRVHDLNAYAFDNHLRPQVDFLPPDAKVFRLEDGLQTVVTWLSGVTKTPLELTDRALETRCKTRVCFATRCLIEQAYRSDFDRFGYTVRCAAQPPRNHPGLIANLIARLVVWLDRRGMM